MKYTVPGLAGKRVSLLPSIEHPPALLCSPTPRLYCRPQALNPTRLSLPGLPGPCNVVPFLEFGMVFWVGLLLGLPKKVLHWSV